MIGQSENIELLLILIPVGPDTRETTGPVMQCMIGDTHLCLIDWNDFSFEEGECCHSDTAV